MNKLLKISLLFFAMSLLFNSALFAAVYEPVKFEDVDSGMPYDVKQVPVTKPDSLKGIKIAVIAAHGFEEVEATYPIDYLGVRGAAIEVITPDWIKGRVMAVRFLKPSLWIPVTKQISQAKAEDYDMILIPGGAWNPIIMRTDGQILDFIKKANENKLLITSICHGPQVLLSAGIIKGKTATGVGDIRGDMKNGGVNVIENLPVVVDGNILTSRDPKDLAEFCMAIEKYLAVKNKSRNVLKK
ncbi:MAG: DJ-1/PfpI family protein [Candidatus Wallbacteria bacterium]